MPTPDSLHQPDPWRQEPEHCMGRRCRKFTPDCPTTLVESCQSKPMTDCWLCPARDQLPNRAQTPNPKVTKPGISLAACAPTEWSRRRNVVGVAVPALVMLLLQTGNAVHQ